MGDEGIVFDPSFMSQYYICSLAVAILGDISVGSTNLWGVDQWAHDAVYQAVESGEGLGLEPGGGLGLGLSLKPLACFFFLCC